MESKTQSLVSTRPNYYHKGGIDVFTYIEANLSLDAIIGYHQASAIKYIIRAGKKPGNPRNQDFQKAIVHIQKLVDLTEHYDE